MDEHRMPSYDWPEVRYCKLTRGQDSDRSSGRHDDGRYDGVNNFVLLDKRHLSLLARQTLG